MWELIRLHSYHHFLAARKCLEIFSFQQRLMNTFCLRNNKNFKDDRELSLYFFFQHVLLIPKSLNDNTSVQFVQFGRSVMSDSLQPHRLQHDSLPCSSPSPGAYSNTCPSSRWCHPTISFSVVPFSCPQFFPASGSFPMNQFFALGGQSIRVSASASVLPMNTQDWSPLGWTGWISLQSKGLSRVFSNTTVQKHQFFDAQLSL